LFWRGRGVFACISPWNFPVAIFTGQVVAALVSGNTVVAKPSKQTPHCAYAVVRLLHDAGVPPSVLQLLLGDGSIGAALVTDPELAGVCFTGSNATAKSIQRSVAECNPTIIPLIAETGGINGMIVDSSAVLDAAAEAATVSAFRSAGQRCSALRLLLVEAPVAEELLHLVKARMSAMTIGSPLDPKTQIGPVIDKGAQSMLLSYCAEMESKGFNCLVSPASCPTAGYFVRPALIEVNGVRDVERECFGPILHFCAYREGEIQAVLHELEAEGFGLTMGLHSTRANQVDLIRRRGRAGNIYVNRTIIGAVVEAQPFGGEGLSGTGPKAGGPHYLHRFATERTVSIDRSVALSR
jgi:RHH-type proline utilization regulon transcriptional repressor/proline dehydrogenase/delta 1-pyrroline-5-carboxylate dehydrogenase